MDPFTVATLTTILGRLLPEPQAGLLAGILFGTRASMSRALTDAFIATGTIHIIALSGQNVSIVTGLMASSLVHLVSRRIASLLTLLVLGLFLWFVGPSPSLIRAVIMGSLTLFSIIFGKQNWSLLSLALAVTIMLVLNPLWITDLGFQLSVLATLGIILFGGTTERMHRENRKSLWRKSKVVIDDRKELVDSTMQASSFDSPLRLSNFDILFSFIHFVSGQLRHVMESDLRITLAAQLFTTPLIFLAFHRISLVAPLTNILIGWTMPFLMGLGWLAAIAGYFWWPMGVLPAWGAWVLLTYVIRVVEWTGAWPVASLAW
ncbi:MAG: ComEC/Rec2 family competence protein [Candidatus Gottesmanbacteria bacterium]|nr:ComEC/Rec2 family competence protein [Candidatus Gottesmanbacteria bacterium]